DAKDVQAGDLAGVLGGLALAVVEVGRDRDDGFDDLLAEMVLGGLLHLLEDERRDLGRAVLLPPNLDPGVAVVRPDDLVGGDLHRLLHLGVVKATADEALDGENRVFRVGDRLTAGDLPGQPLATVREGDHGGGDAAPFCVRDDYRVATFHDGDTGIGGPEIDSDDFGHELSSRAL